MLPADGFEHELKPWWPQQIAARVACRISSVSAGVLVCLRCVWRLCMCLAHALSPCKKGQDNVCGKMMTTVHKSCSRHLAI